MTDCAISDDECSGNSGEAGSIDVALCQFHQRVLSELGERAFHEWYSIELGIAPSPDRSGEAIETPKSDSTEGESRIGSKPYREATVREEGEV